MRECVCNVWEAFRSNHFYAWKMHHEGYSNVKFKKAEICLKIRCFIPNCTSFCVYWNVNKVDIYKHNTNICWKPILYLIVIFKFVNLEKSMIYQVSRPDIDDFHNCISFSYFNVMTVYCKYCRNTKWNLWHTKYWYWGFQM